MPSFSMNLRVYPCVRDEGSREKISVMQSLWILLATFATTCGFVLTKTVDPAVAFFDILLVRSTFMLAVAGGLAYWNGMSIGTKHPLLHLIRAAAGFTALSINIVVVRHLPLAVSQTLIFMAPLFVTGYAIGRGLWQGRRPDWKLALTVVVGFGGVLLVYRPASGLGMGFYALLAVFSAMMTAVTGLVLKQMGRLGEPVVRTVFLFSLAGVVLSGIAVMLFSMQNLADLFCNPILLAIGLTSAVAHLAQAQGWGKGKPLLCACLQFSPIPFAALADAVFFDCFPGTLSLVGIAVIALSELSGVLLVRREGEARSN